MTPAEIERLYEEVHSLHVRRLDLPLEDLRPKRFKRRPRPNTAIVSLAAQRLRYTRSWLSDMMSTWSAHDMNTPTLVNTSQNPTDKA